MGKSRDEEIWRHGGVPPAVRKSWEWLDAESIHLDEEEFAQWLEALADRIRHENLPPLVLRIAPAKK